MILPHPRERGHQPACAEGDRLLEAPTDKSNPRNVLPRGVGLEEQVDQMAARWRGGVVGQGVRDRGARVPSGVWPVGAERGVWLPGVGVAQSEPVPSWQLNPQGRVRARRCSSIEHRAPRVPQDPGGVQAGDGEATELSVQMGQRPSWPLPPRPPHPPPRSPVPSHSPAGFLPGLRREGGAGARTSGV